MDAHDSLCWGRRYYILSLSSVDQVLIASVRLSGADAVLTTQNPTSVNYGASRSLQCIETSASADESRHDYRVESVEELGRRSSVYYLH